MYCQQRREGKRRRREEGVVSWLAEIEKKKIKNEKTGLAVVVA